MTFSTCDLCDDHGKTLQVADSIFQNYGGNKVFGGEIVTIKCHEDNSLVKDIVAKLGNGKVLVVDGGGSLRCSLLGDQLAAKAVANGWEGLIIYGAIRDVEVIAELDRKIDDDSPDSGVMQIGDTTKFAACYTAVSGTTPASYNLQNASDNCAAVFRNF